MKATIENITPRKAEVLLGKNTNNRTISAKRVKVYAEAMDRGDWQVTGQPIILDESGHLMDGQHRLAACVASGRSFKTMVVRGAAREAMHALDTGKRRTLRDNLSINGHRHTTALAGALNWLHRLLTGDLATYNVPTHAEALELLEAEPELIDEVQYWASSNKLRHICPNVPQWVALAYVVRTRCTYRQPDIERFFNQVRTGTGLEEGDPALALRDRWYRIKGERGTTGKRTDSRALMIYNIRAWNTFYRGRKTGRLLLPKVAADGKIHTPTIKGWRGCGWR